MSRSDAGDITFIGISVECQQPHIGIRFLYEVRTAGGTLIIGQLDVLPIALEVHLTPAELRSRIGVVSTASPGRARFALPPSVISRPAGTMAEPGRPELPGDLKYIQYEHSLESQYLPAIRSLISKDLSEPYSVYVYRYFLYQWGHLCFMVGYDAASLLPSFRLLSERLAWLNAPYPCWMAG